MVLATNVWPERNWAQLAGRANRTARWPIPRLISCHLSSGQLAASTTSRQIRLGALRLSHLGSGQSRGGPGEIFSDDLHFPIPAELQEIEATEADWEEYIQERYGEDLEETELSMRAGGIDSALRWALRLMHSLRKA